MDTEMGGISSQPPRKGMSRSPLGWTEKGSAPKGQPQPMDSAQGDAAPQQCFTLQQLWEGKPTQQWGSQWGSHPSGSHAPSQRDAEQSAPPTSHSLG